MSLYFPADEPSVVTTANRLHALIIGVGDYVHLGLGAPQPATFLNGLAPLSTTVPTAARIAKWLQSDYKNPVCPLGSIELLLSPAPESPTAGAPSIEPATMGNIAAAFNRWYGRCNSQRGNLAFFYFAGHGISTLSQFLLPADFGNPAIPDEWENCIDVTGLQTGMAKCAAQRQLFFVDACRDAPIAALVQRNPHGKPLVSSSYTDRVELSAAYLAASEGRKAYGRDGEETFFCKALITCLDGVAARKAGPQWQIDAASLSTGLVSVTEFLGAVENLPLTAECRVQRPVPFHFPADGAVVLKVDCDPDQANAESTIRVTQGSTVYSSDAGSRRPWMQRLQAGDVRVEVTFASFPQEVVTDRLTPPTYVVAVHR